MMHLWSNSLPEQNSNSSGNNSNTTSNINSSSNDNGSSHRNENEHVGNQLHNAMNPEARFGHDATAPSTGVGSSLPERYTTRKDVGVNIDGNGTNSSSGDAGAYQSLLSAAATGGGGW